MKIQKELDKIAWNVNEPTYREDPALSYSTLSTYEKTGFNGLDHLFDKKEGASLAFGSVVDCLTLEPDEFNDRFIVADINVTEGGINTCTQLLQMHLEYPSFNDIPQETVSAAAKAAGFWAGDKYDKTRYQKVLATGNIAEYYQTLLSSDKTVISTEMYNDAQNCVKALKETPVTSGYFADNDDMSPIRRYYQLKFKAKFGYVTYRSMMDLIVVDYDNKVIYPCDLKTCGVSEWDFEDNFMRFHYAIQARLYWRVLKANLMHDDYFKDFTLEDFRFIVVNRQSLIPLVWVFPLTDATGTLVNNNGYKYRDPFEIGEELQAYLNLRPEVPNGINKDSFNIIQCLKLENTTESDNK